MTPRASNHPLLRTLLRWGATLVILALLIRFLPFAQLGSAMRRVPAGLWLLLLAGYLTVHGVAILKWRLMVNLGGAELGVAQAARCYLSGLFGTLFLPSIVGGDVVRLGLAMRLARHRAGAMLGSVMDRLLDVTALVTVAASGALLLHGALDPRSRKIFWAIAAVGLALAALVGLLLTLLPARRFSHAIRRQMVRLRQAVRAMSRRPERVLLAFAMGVSVQATFVLLTAELAAVCGLHLPLRVWLLVWPLAKLSGLLPVSQGGIGVRELALAALAAPFGAPPVLTVAVGLVLETIVVASGLAAGLGAFLLGRHPGAREAVSPAVLEKAKS